MPNKAYHVKHGNPYPSGAKFNEGGVNFSIFSRHATKVELLLFETSTCDKPFQVITLSKESAPHIFCMAYFCHRPAGRHLVHLAHGWTL